MGDPISIVINPLVESVIGEITSLIRNEYRLLKGIKGYIEELESKLTTIKSVLADAEDKQHESKQLRDWLGNLQEAAYDAQDILETFSTEAFMWEKRKKVKNFWTLNLDKASYKHEAANKIKTLLARLAQIADDKEKFNLNVINANPIIPDSRNTSFHVNGLDIVGRQDDKEKIVNILKSEEFDSEDNVSVIPVIGMGGLGKTTLAQLVYNDDRVGEDYFLVRMWVCVTDNFNYRRIIKEMIEHYSDMNVDISTLSDNQVESRLLEVLGNKRFLLVLDDVWTESYEDWEILQRLLKHGGKGSRVLVTSRTTRVAEVMGTQPAYLLDYLPEDQCWSLFEKVAVFKQRNLTNSEFKKLEEIGRRIVQKCEGLPLAVKAMGGILRGNNVLQKWRSIENHDVWEAEKLSITTGKPKVLPALKLSYDHLPSYLKRCFAYCYIFPKAYVYQKMEIVKFWKGASLIQSRGQDTPDEIGSDFFNDLLTRSFFQQLQVDKDDTVVIYKMHDLIHDLAQSVSVPHCYQVKDKESCNKISETSRHVSLLSKDAEQLAMDVILKKKRLRTLVSPTEYLKDYNLVIDKVFKTLKYIRILDLSSRKLKDMPESVGELKLLRFLDLSKTQIENLPDTICSLYNLQTLKLLECRWLSTLPKNLSNLVNLQHLELDDMFWYNLQALPPKLGSLTGLQNLHAFLVNREIGHGIDELGDMKYLTGPLHISKLENAVNSDEAKLQDKEGLTKVVLEWSIDRDGSPKDSVSDKRILEDLQPHEDIKELQIINYMGTVFPSWLGDGPVLNLVKLTLKGCMKCSLVSLSQLMCLKELYIKGLLELEEWRDAEYKSLSSLTLSNCPKLKRLPSAFMSLRVLKIKKCSLLETMSLTPFLNFLVLIDNTSLHNWNELMLRVTTNDQGRVEVQTLYSFLGVLELKMKNCPRMSALPNYFAPQKLEISACPLLTNLPIPNFCTRLQHVQLDTFSDGTLVNKIPAAPMLYSLVISNILTVKHLPEFPHLPALTVLYIHNCNDLESITEEMTFQGLNNLRLLSIRGCSKLVTLQGKGLLPSTLECLSISSCINLKVLGHNEILKNVTSLKDLYIDDCPALQSLPGEGLPTSITHLRIEGCPLLTKQCQKNPEGPYWPKIMNIPDLEFDDIEVVAAHVPRGRTWGKGNASKGKNPLHQYASDT